MSGDVNHHPSKEYGIISMSPLDCQQSQVQTFWVFHNHNPRLSKNGAILDVHAPHFHSPIGIDPSPVWTGQKHWKSPARVAHVQFVKGWLHHLGRDFPPRVMIK